MVPWSKPGQGVPSILNKELGTKDFVSPFLTKYAVFGISSVMHPLICFTANAYKKKTQATGGVFRLR